MPSRWLPASPDGVLGIFNETMFENSGRRIFYEDKIARDLADSNLFGVASARSSAPKARSGTASGE